MGDDVQVGRTVRDIRVTKNLRQEDLAARAGVSRQTVSRLERGLVDGMTVGTLRAIGRALEMPPVVTLGWRTPELERLRDRLHASVVEEVVSILLAAGWEIAPERSFNHYGERGAADVLAWHASFRALLIVEVKTRLWDLQDLLAGLDRSRRLLPGLAAREWEWKARAVGVALVMPDMSTHRHVIERHSATFGAALPDRHPEVHRWIGQPDRDLRGIWFLPISRQGSIGQRSWRVRAVRARPKGRRGARDGRNGPESGRNGAP
jgi:transcriptional regulator with XRE-family HTH domain